MEISINGKEQLEFILLKYPELKTLRIVTDDFSILEYFIGHNLCNLYIYSKLYRPISRLQLTFTSLKRINGKKITHISKQRKLLNFYCKLYKLDFSISFLLTNFLQ
jgi:hypothetical protein